MRDLSGACIAKMEVANALRFAFENQLRCPRVGFASDLRTCKSVNICAVLGDVDKVAQVPHDELRLVFSPNGVGLRDNAKRLGWLFRYFEKASLAVVYGIVVTRHFMLMRKPSEAR